MNQTVSQKWIVICIKTANDTETAVQQNSCYTFYGIWQTSAEKINTINDYAVYLNKILLITSGIILCNYNQLQWKAHISRINVTVYKIK